MRLIYKDVSNNKTKICVIEGSCIYNVDNKHLVLFPSNEDIMTHAADFTDKEFNKFLKCGVIDLSNTHDRICRDNRIYLVRKGDDKS